MALRVSKVMGVALFLSLAACGLKTQSTNRDLAALKRDHAAFLAATGAHRFAAMKAAYADDALMILPGLPPMKGIDAISADYQNIAADPAAWLGANTQSVTLSAGGDLGFAEGEYRVRYTNPTTKVIEHAKDFYILIYRKQTDGSWKIIRDVSSPLPE